MKKALYSFILMAFTLCTYAVPYVPPVNFMEISPCDEVMNMDGNDTEGSWGAAQGFTLFNSSGWSNSADFSGYFKVCWDMDYLYLFTDITDEYNHSYDPSWTNPWMFDNIEIFIDLDTVNHPSTAYDDNTIQLRFNRGFSSPEASGRADAGDFLYHYEEKAGGDGWIVEAGIPWTCVLPSGSLPGDIHEYVENAMGFDINFADSDNSDGDYTVGNRDVQGAWDMDGGTGDEDLAWNNTSVFGIVELLTEPYPPAIPYTQPVRTLNVPAREDRIVFDGEDNEDSWSALQDVSLFNTAGYSGTSDFDAGFRLTWDMEYLYFYAEITDDVDHSWAPGRGDVWMFDNIELFLDLDTVMGSTGYDENSIQLRFSRGLNEVETPGRAPAGDFYYFWENTGNGWVVETGIPWTCVMPSGWIPEDFMYFVSQYMGFDVNFADSDNSDGNPDVGNRDAQSAWDADGLDGTEDLAWNNTHVFGIIDLIGEPAGSNPEPDGVPYVEPVRDMDIPGMSGDFTQDIFDGENFWSYPQQLTVFNPSQYAGGDDLDASFRVAWDYDHLYMYAEIADDIEQNWSSGLANPEYYDNLEVYIDLDTFCMDPAWRSNSTTMIRFCRGSDQVQETGRAGASDFIYSWENTSTGWALETAIPWTCALPAGADISDFEDYMPTIGFDVIVNDLDAASPVGRSGMTQAGWDPDDEVAGESPAEDLAMENTRVFGVANLSPYFVRLPDIKGDALLRIYPNPASDRLFIRSEKPVSQVKVRDISGRLMMESQDFWAGNVMDISRLLPGTYLVTCSFRDGTQQSELIIKQ